MCSVVQAMTMPGPIMCQAEARGIVVHWEPCWVMGQAVLTNIFVPLSPLSESPILDIPQAGSLSHACQYGAKNCKSQLVGQALIGGEVNPNGEASRTESYEPVSNQSSKPKGALLHSAEVRCFVAQL